MEWLSFVLGVVVGLVVGVLLGVLGLPMCVIGKDSDGRSWELMHNCGRRAEGPNAIRFFESERRKYEN